MSSKIDCILSELIKKNRGYIYGKFSKINIPFYFVTN